tara:strand:- start:16228 stop:16932 length:705 start_codon:yes stop_codon:yes gene_type:complete
MGEATHIYIKTVAIQSLFFYIWRMFKKWYVITFLVVLSVLGFVSQEQIAIPNQEIVLQFTDVEITSQDAQSTIAVVKRQLQNLGADNIQVKESNNGKLKITYYSSTDISIIKDTFSKDEIVDVDYTSQNQNKKTEGFPSGKNSITYNLDVYEIENEADSDWDFNGISVIEFDSKSDRFFDPNPYFTGSNIGFRIKNNSVKVAYTIHYRIAIVLDKASKSIPEVRAGPHLLWDYS